MRTTVDLPDDLYRQLKARAAIGGMKVLELTYVERGLQVLPYFAAFARVSGCRLVTFDGDVERLPEIRLLRLQSRDR